MEYKLMITPFEYIPFDEMNKKQVEEYFQWFLIEKEMRINQLQQFINASKHNSVLLDKSPQSLHYLWEWFENTMEWEEVSETVLRQRLEGRPEWMHEEILSNRWEATVQTKAIAVDISTYFGDTLILNNPEISWGYRTKPKRLDGRNQPILVGFHKEVNVNPRSLIRVCIKKSRRDKCQTRLLNLYYIWVGQII